ncbi:MAG: SGNH/GDSL hydrolase family protein [Planctomycetales bacterium]
MRYCGWIVGAWLVCGLSPAWGADALNLKNGDRLILLGSTLIEREQSYGYWEEALTRAVPSASFTLRNLGWSGDNVWAESRAGFGTPEDGFKELREQVLALKPTVILVNYGANESYAGAAGLEKFKAGLNRMLDMLAESKARLVLASPTREEFQGGKLPNPAAHNKDLELYSQTIKAIADQRKIPFVDLFSRIIPASTAPVPADTRLTENGLHLTAVGYRKTADEFVTALGLKPADGQAPAEFREGIVRKNELYFYRWRPQNVTYLFGFRKHEQGNNAKEVAEFDPLIAKEEEKIQKLKLEKVKEVAVPKAQAPSQPETAKSESPKSEAVKPEAGQSGTGQSGSFGSGTQPIKKRRAVRQLTR